MAYEIRYLNAYRSLVNNGLCVTITRYEDHYSRETKRTYREYRDITKASRRRLENYSTTLANHAQSNGREFDLRVVYGTDAPYVVIRDVKRKK